jgi:hypothetical protein
MRYFDLELSPAEGGLHPVDRELAVLPGVTRAAVRHVDAFDDGTGVFLYRLGGDRAAATALAEESEAVLSHDLVGVDSDRFHLYLHVPPGEPAGTLMALCHEYGLMIDTPIESSSRGDAQVTVVGRHERLRAALEDAPESVGVSVEEIGEYTPAESEVLSLLTGRQRDVFETAVEMGYYEIPRRVNQRDLAAELDLAPSTVDEHLRKAESRMLLAVLGDRGDLPD